MATTAFTALARIFSDVQPAPAPAPAPRRTSSAWFAEKDKALDELQRMAAAMGIGAAARERRGRRWATPLAASRLPPPPPPPPRSAAATARERAAATAAASAVHNQLNSETRKRNKQHRRNLTGIQARVSRGNLSHTFMSPSPHKPANSRGAFYVSFDDHNDDKATCEVVASKTQEQIASTTNAKSGEDFRRHRQRMKKQLKSPQMGDSHNCDAGIEIILPRNNVLSDQIHSLRRECHEKLGPDALVKAREALRDGVPLDHILNSQETGIFSLEDLKRVKQLLYLEDAFYG